MRELRRGKKTSSSRPGRHAITRSAWVFVTQSASSASNLGLTLLVLASATPQEFGDFSICLTSYLLIVQLTRTCLSLPLLVLYSGHETKIVSRETRPALGLALFIGCVAAVPLVITGMAFQGAGTAFVVLAMSLPFLLYQDVARHVAIARAKPHLAAAADCLWLALQVGASVAVIVTSHGSPIVLFVIWAVAGILSAIGLGAYMGARPVLHGLGDWLRTNKSLLGRMLAEFGLNSGSYYALSYGLAILSGAEQLGRLRAAQAFIGPVSVLVLGGVVLGVPESVRVRHDRAALRRFATRLAAFLAATSVVGGGLSYLVLPVIGPQLFPKTWAFARPIIPALTVYATVIGISLGALSALRATGGDRWIVRARILTAGSVIAIGLPLSRISGACGAVLTLASVETVFAISAWRHFARTPVSSQSDAVENQPPASQDRC